MFEELGRALRVDTLALNLFGDLRLRLRIRCSEGIDWWSM
jgi:hypothetical protein